VAVFRFPPTNLTSLAHPPPPADSSSPPEQVVHGVIPEVQPSQLPPHQPFRPPYTFFFTSPLGPLPPTYIYNTSPDCNLNVPLVYPPLPAIPHKRPSVTPLPPPPHRSSISYSQS
jgi:hypothetical protein